MDLFEKARSRIARPSRLKHVGGLSHDGAMTLGVLLGLPFSLAFQRPILLVVLFMLCVVARFVYAWLRSLAWVEASPEGVRWKRDEVPTPWHELRLRCRNIFLIPVVQLVDAKGRTVPTGGEQWSAATVRLRMHDLVSETPRPREFRFGVFAVGIYILASLAAFTVAPIFAVLAVALAIWFAARWLADESLRAFQVRPDPSHFLSYGERFSQWRVGEIRILPTRQVESQPKGMRDVRLGTIALGLACVTVAALSQAKLVSWAVFWIVLALAGIGLCLIFFVLREPPTVPPVPLRLRRTETGVEVFSEGGCSETVPLAWESIYDHPSHRSGYLLLQTKAWGPVLFNPDDPFQHP